MPIRLHGARGAFVVPYDSGHCYWPGGMWSNSEQDVRTDDLTALHDYWVSVYDVNAAVGADVFGVTR